MKSQIVSTYKYTTELHAHSLPVSRCSEFLPKELAHTYQNRGIDTVVLTNHFTPVHIEDIPKDEAVANYISCYREFKKYAEEVGITAVFGMELRFEENMNDYLIYGISPEETGDIYKYISGNIEIFFKEYKRDDILIFQAHPFRDGMAPIKPASVDGIEVFNLHPGHNSRVALAAKYAQENNLLVCGGTDFHHPGHDGCCLIRTKEKILTPKELVRVLKEKDFVFDIFGNIILP